MFRYTNNNVTKIGVTYLWIWPLCLVSIDLAPRGHIHLFTLHTTITATSLRSRMASLVASRNVTFWALYCIFIPLYYLLDIKIQHLPSCGLPYIMYILLILVIILHLPTVVEKQGKSGGFDSCYWPSNLTQLTLKNIRAPLLCNISFVHRFKAIGILKVELQSGNVQCG